MSESLVFGLIFGIWFFLNFCGIALYHGLWKTKDDYVKDDWKGNRSIEFGLFTGLMLVIGGAYFVLQIMAQIVILIRKWKKQS